MINSEPDYHFRFSDLGDKFKHSQVLVVNNRDKTDVNVAVAVKDNDFLDKLGLQVPSVVADLVDLAVAIHEADRWTNRKKDKACRIQIELPLRTNRIRQDANIVDSLTMALHWMTGDNWSLSFTQYARPGRWSELQSPMLPGQRFQNMEVGLSSGGLDSFAGLINRISNSPTDRKFRLFGGGSNKWLMGIQRTLIVQLSDELARKNLARDLQIAQVQILQKLESSLKRDDNLRARGLVFLLLGAAYALLLGQNKLFVYENGIGAFNLPFRDSWVGLDNSRGVHPITLIWVEQIVSQFSGQAFQVENPFIYSTKAEMCKVIANLALDKLASLSFSCDRPRREYGRYIQCGQCSSCILRRQSLVAAGVQDYTEYRTLLDPPLKERALRKSHLAAMSYQVDQLLKPILQEDDVSAWRVLSQRYPTTLFDSVLRCAQHQNVNLQDMVTQILDLYRRYITEWVGVNFIFDSELNRVLSLDYSAL